MLFPDTSFELFPELSQPPYEELLRAFLSVGFAPDRCRERLEVLIEERALDPAWFDFDAMDAGGITASAKLLFGAFENHAHTPWQWSMRSARRRSFDLRLQAGEVEVIAEFLREAGRSVPVGEFREVWEERLGREVSARLWPPGFEEMPAGKFGFWPDVAAPGIYRREHASLVLRSATTTLVTDPQGCHDGWTTNGLRLPAEREPLAAGCRYFLPYAHGFRGLAVSPQGAEGRQQSEEGMLQPIRRGLAGSRTEVRNWFPGDAALVREGKLMIDARAGSRSDL